MILTNFDGYVESTRAVFPCLVPCSVHHQVRSDTELLSLLVSRDSWTDNIDVIRGDWTLPSHWYRRRVPSQVSGLTEGAVEKLWWYSI